MHNRSYVPHLMEICVHTFIANLIDCYSVVVDLGANIGVFTDEIYSTFGCTIFAIEPVSQLFLRIGTNEKIKKFNYCIAERTGPVRLTIPYDRDATIYQKDGGKQAYSIVAEGIRFDQFLADQNIRTIDLLKVDIEGAEVDLFTSLKAENLQIIKQVTIEFHDFLWPEMHSQVEEIKRKMISGGYYCIPFSLNNGDVLFIRKELISHSAYLYLNYFVKYARGIRRLIKRSLYCQEICH